MASLYTHQSENVRKTLGLMAGFLILLIALGWIFSQALQSPVILYVAVVLALVMNFVSYWNSDKIALAMSRARALGEGEELEYRRVVENLAITAGLPTPRLYIMDAPQINAFATGRDKEHAAVAVTTGALTKLSRVELEGVLAHELSHIGNRDILVSTVIVVLAGIIAMLSDFFMRSMFWGGGRDRGKNGGGLFLVIGIVAAIVAPLAASLIKLAVSREREYLADASGALLTRYPEGLASALEKMSQDETALPGARSGTAHLYIANPFKGGGKALTKLFQTHPPLEDRIARLRNGDK